MTKDNKNLRPYQIELIKNARYILKSNKSLIIQGSTGMGKTVLASFMLKALAEQNKRGLFICHRRELIEQASKSFNDFNINHAIIGTGYKKDLENPIQICSALSLFNKLDLIKKPDFIIWDECHHIASSTWSKIFNYFPNAHHIGLTATPQRLDGKGLGKFFEKMIQAPPMRELINQGYLSDFDIYAPSTIDLEGVASKNGDYDQEQLGKVVNKPTITGCAIEHYKKICNNKKAIVFCVSINHSLEVVKKFNDAGIKAAHIDGQMTNKQRDELINKFQDRELKILSNVDIVGEGFDLPAIEAAILLRPTQSLTLYLQQVGRALRRSQGKDKAIILDHAGNSLRHKMPDFENIWDLNYDVMKNKKEVKKVISYKSCPECNLVVNKSRAECDCGYSFTKNREINQIDGKLNLLNKKVTLPKLENSQVIEVILLYNKGMRTTDIAHKMNIHKSTIQAITAGVSWKEISSAHLINKEEWAIRNLDLRIEQGYDLDPNNNCWIWKKNITKKGKMSIKLQGKSLNLKNYIFEREFGSFSSKEVIVNKCSTHKCINPLHLEAVSYSERSKRTAKLLKSKNPNYFIDKGKKGNEFLRKKLGNDAYKTLKASALEKAQKIQQKMVSLINIDTNEKINFNSITDAATYLNCFNSTIFRKVDTDKPYKGYLIKSYLPF